MENKKKLITIVLGTRPEAIKLAPVIKTFEKCEKFKTRVIITGQHKEMVHEVLKIFDIEPQRDLNIMQHKQSLTQITCLSLPSSWVCWIIFLISNKSFQDLRYSHPPCLFLIWNVNSEYEMNNNTLAVLMASRFLVTSCGNHGLASATGRAVQHAIARTCNAECNSRTMTNWQAVGS